MVDDLLFEQRLEALELAVAQLQTQLSVTDGNWIDKFIGSVTDDEAFQQAMAYGRAFRISDRPSDEPGDPLRPPEIPWRHMVGRFIRITPRFPVADLQRTLAFYEQTLGFRIDIAYPEDKPTFCILKRDDVRLGFFVPDEHRPNAATGNGECYIEVHDSVGLHEAIKGRVAIEWGPEVYWYGRREFALRDPDGYLVIFTEPTDDPPTCIDV
ncbi:MAG TPA: VOC family protein [Gemmataceae bacterium]|nr:VOC family protein [Gemmataceae bacterium]